MKFIGLNDRQLNLKNPKKYLINWEKPSRSIFQSKVKKYLHTFWKSDIVFEEFRLVGTRLSFDFYNANKKIALEVDGKQHYQYVPHFHGGNRSKFLGQLQRDEKKELFCEINNIKLVRILESDMLSKSLLKELELI